MVLQKVAAESNPVSVCLAIRIRPHCPLKRDDRQNECDRAPERHVGRGGNPNKRTKNLQRHPSWERPQLAYFSTILIHWRSVIAVMISLRGRMRDSDATLDAL